ncbi:MAG: LD-carboxypeptidase [Agriterribacter sp.]
MITIPPYLQKGDTIGITCPAGYMAYEKATTCIKTLQQWGFTVKVGKTLGSNSVNYFAGTDEERLQDFQSMLDDSSIKAILCGRGGYGSGRIIDQINFKKFKKNPKWIIGFSDITVIHSHILSNFKISSLHAPMAGAFNDGGNRKKFVLSLREALTGKPSVYTAKPNRYNKHGKAEGILAGGNLCLLAHLTGSASDINTNGKILFIEDVGEYLYNIDRMLYQVKRAGKLSKLAALIVGGFTDLKDTERPFGKSVYEIIRDIVKEYDYPVCFNFPVSHGKENVALKVGVHHQITITNKEVILKEK